MMHGDEEGWTGVGGTPRLSPFWGSHLVVASCWWEQALVSMPSRWVPGSEGEGPRASPVALGQAWSGVGWVVEASEKGKKGLETVKPGSAVPWEIPTPSTVQGNA